MKVIFLDIDGVLNSRRYDAGRTETDGNIDVTRLVLLKELTERTGAQIVLTSSWRTHWDPHGKNSDDTGKELEQIFCSNGVPLYDKTRFAQNNRPLEIAGWIAMHDDIEAFVILDDIKLGWGPLDSFVVKTGYNIGLEQCHINDAADILKRNF